MKFISAITFIALITFSLVSCRKELDNNSSELICDYSHDVRLNLLSKSLRLPITSLRACEEGVFMGDVFYSNEYIDELRQKSHLFYQAPLVSAQHVSNIKIYFQQPLDPSWVTATNEAIAEINALPNCKLNIGTISSNINAPNVIRFYTWTGAIQIGLDYSYGGAGPPGPSGNVGSTMFVFNNGTGYYSNWSAASKKYFVAHMILHCVGLQHDLHPSLYPSGPHISGSANQYEDYNSIMRGYQSSYENPIIRPWNTGIYFSIWDKYALALLYPERAPIIGTLPWYRYRHIDQWNYHCHYYTTNWMEYKGDLTENTSTSFIYEGITGYLFPNNQIGCLNLHRYKLIGNDKHFYTTNPSELGSGISNWVYEGVNGSISPTQLTGTFPLHRYYNSSTGNHLWTMDLLPNPQSFGYQYDLLVGYVYPDPLK